jgi:hypothetical protein
MAVGFPTKVTYANGDVFSASDINDTNGTINLLGSSVAYTAGKNKLINGDFGVWQRGTSSAASGINTADRWFCAIGGTVTFSQDTSIPSDVFTQYSLKWTTGASSSFGQIFQAMERALVIPMRGEPMAFSIYVRTTGTAFSGTLRLVAYYSNSTDAYASSTSVTVTGAQTITPTGTWTRYTGTFTVPSDAVGLRIGVEPSVVQASGVVVYFAGAQLEQGSTATAFQTASGTIQGELALCQRYYQRFTSGTVFGSMPVYAVSSTSTIIRGFVSTPVSLRTIPTAVDFSALGWETNFGGTVTSISNATFYSTCGSAAAPVVEFTTTGVSASPVYYTIVTNNNAAGYLGLSAEL